MKYVICSRCTQKKQVRHNRYKQLLITYNGKVNLKAKYICNKCKINKAYKLLKGKTSGSKQQNLEDILSLLPEVNAIKNKMIKNVEWINQGRLGDKYSRDLFYNMLKSLLSDHKVSDFSINVLDNKVVSITLNGLPLLGKYTIGVI